MRWNLSATLSANERPGMNYGTSMQTNILGRTAIIAHRRIAAAAFILPVILTGTCCGGADAATTSRVVDTALGCVETVVTRSAAPTGQSMADGGSIGFLNDIAPGHGVANETIRSVYVPPNGSPNTNVHDRVRVCLITMPKKTGRGPGTCDPAVDIRGRQFLIFDRSNNQAAVFSNGEHDCGGA